MRSEQEGSLHQVLQQAWLGELVEAFESGYQTLAYTSLECSAAGSIVRRSHLRCAVW